MDLIDELARLQRRMQELKLESERLTAELDKLSKESVVLTPAAAPLIAAPEVLHGESSSEKEDA